MPYEGGRRRKKAYDFEAFRGYRGPRFTPIPDEFLDHQLAHVSSAEAKVMLFLFRKTYGYRKSGDRVSLAQLEHGTVSADGTIIDRGTGLSRATIWRALKGLQAKGLIEVHRQVTPAGDSDINYYRIREQLSPEEGFEREDDPGSSSFDPPGPSRGSSRPRSGGEARRRDHETSRDAASSAPRGGSFRNETTPSSELNHRPLRSKPPGGFSSEPTRKDVTREDSTLTHSAPRARSAEAQRPSTAHPMTDEAASLQELAHTFLKALGYAKPAAAKRERTVRVLRTLQEQEDYTFDELRTACELAAAMGARGPELLPHVIGRASVARPESKVGERLSQQEALEHSRWESLTARFEAFDPSERERLLRAARETNVILARRPLDHPLVRAAAIARLDAS